MWKRGRGDQGAQAQQELSGFKAEDVAAASEAALHRIENGAIGCLLEAALGERGAQAVAAELFEPGAVIGVTVRPA